MGAEDTSEVAAKPAVLTESGTGLTRRGLISRLHEHVNLVS